MSKGSRECGKVGDSQAAELDFGDWCLVAGKPLQPTGHGVITMYLLCPTETWEGVQYIV